MDSVNSLNIVAWSMLIRNCTGYVYGLIKLSTWRDNLAILLHFLLFIIVLHCNTLNLQCTFYANNICCPENIDTVASEGGKNVLCQ